MGERSAAGPGAGLRPTPRGDVSDPGSDPRAPPGEGFDDHPRPGSRRAPGGHDPVRFRFFTFDPQTNPNGSGEVTEQLTVDGDLLHGSLTLTLFDINGTPVPPVLTGVIRATRIEVD